MNVKQLCRIWWDVFGRYPIVKWSSTLGPVQRMHVSLHRIGWRAHSPVAWTDDRGECIELLFNSPSMVARLLQDGVQRQHERDLAARWEGFQGNRVCVDPILPLLTPASKKMTPQGKYLVATAFCGGLWDGKRCCEAGYEANLMCPLCGLEPDTVEHRLWRCMAPQVVAARKAVCSDAFVDTARGGPRGFYDGLRWAHPSSELPGPSKEVNPILYDPAGTPVPWGSLDLRDCDVAIDGSASRPAVRELARASYAWVFLGTGEEVKAYAKGTVWSSLPQTSQAAEHMASTLLALHHPQSGIQHSDCMNVVNVASLPASAQMSCKNRYAGLRRCAIHERAARDLHEPITRYTPAHRSADKIAALPDAERRIASGNDKADRYAKEALRDHPQATPAELQKVDDEVTAMRTVALVMAAVLPLFPVVKHERPPRGKRPRPQKVLWHDWECV